jgi:hypothetical protein
MKTVLPMKTYDFKRTLRIIQYYQVRNQKAKKAHTKKKLVKIGYLAL